jgi:hypothetical protein
MNQGNYCSSHRVESPGFRGEDVSGKHAEPAMTVRVPKALKASARS